MKVITKKITIAVLSVIFAVLLTLGIVLASSKSIAQADDVSTAPNATTYFYDHLTDANEQEYTLAKKFYKALEKMNEEGDFIDGVVDYNIAEIATSEQIKNWIDGKNLEVPKAFSAARDAFLTDHPELFYINFYKMTISVAMSGGNYVGFINSGREANLYYENGFNTKAAVEDAIAKFNAKIDEIVAKMKKLEAEDTYTARDAYLAKEVNRYLAENIKYDYVAYDNREDPNYIAASYINSAYGGLVEGKAVCGGFSNSYKVIMDRLEIPCITVNGYSNNKDQNGNNSASNVYHMWNYVWLENPSEPEQSTAKRSAARTAQDGAWYSVDVTWNHSSKNKYRYAVLNDKSDSDIHVTDGVISSSGYELKYPGLSEFNYGSTRETSGLQSSRIYEPVDDGSKDDYGNPLVNNYAIVSYNGKSAKTLFEEDNLYLVCRFAYYIGLDFTWTKWMALEQFRQYAELAIDQYGVMIQDDGSETRFYDNTSIYYTQFAVFDSAPDVKHHVHSDTLGIDKDYYFEYSDELVSQSNAIETGEMFINKSYGTYIAPPYIKQDSQQTTVISDSMRDPKITNKVVCAENKAITFEVTYDEPLHKLDEDEPIEISFVSDHPNTKDYAKFFPIGKDENGEPINVELIESEEGSGVFDTLRFKFGPSLMYEHDQEGYHFIFKNVGSAKEITRIVNGNPVVEYSNKMPNAAYIHFGRDVVACPACFNYDGRLWIECCAAPTLVTQTDLAAMDFKDENGESTFSENERSQMMLVAERANTETINTILDGIGGIENSNVTKDDIKTSETYDIRLQMCNKYPTIPDGSYVKIGLGFPEGYGPNDEGVTFKLYHRKHIKGDEYIIEEVPCVVTQFGIVATVTSFSPYMVAVVDADKATDKTVYASIEGKGGTLTKEDGKIRSFKEGDSYTYTIQPNEGYKIYSVSLNGKNVLDKVVKGKLTVKYDDLGTNNELVIQYIANEAADRIQAKLDRNVIEQQIEVGKSVINAKGDLEASVSMPSHDVNPKDFVQVNNNLSIGMIILIISIAVVVIAIGVAVAVIIIKKRKTDE